MARSDLRASDADREQVAEQLRHATAEGRLAAHELEHRLGIALSARTYGELDGVTGDLPGRKAMSTRRGARSLARAHPVTAAAVAIAAIAVTIATIAVLAVIGAAWIGWMVFAWLCFGRRHHRHHGHRRRGGGRGRGGLLDPRTDPRGVWSADSRALGSVTPRP